MSLIYEPQKHLIKLAQKLREGMYKKIILVSWHGLGDQILLMAPLKKLRSLFPDIQIDIAVCKGLDQKFVFPEAIEVEGNWRETLQSEYDLIVQINMPLESPDNVSLTKAEGCCIEELGIEPTSGHERLIAKKLVGISYHCTSVPWVANADEDVAKKIWDDVKEAGFIPFECTMKHPFFNPENKLYPFVDNHIRDWPAKIETLAAMIGSCNAFISAVGGPFHLALSILGPSRVMLLEKDLKAGHFTKSQIVTANLKDYQGEVKTFLEGLK